MLGASVLIYSHVKKSVIPGAKMMGNWASLQSPSANDIGMCRQSIEKKSIVFRAFWVWMRMQYFGIRGSQGVEVDDTEPTVAPRLGEANTSSEGRIIMG